MRPGILLVLVRGALAFSSGAPANKCGDGVPGHSGITKVPPQTMIGYTLKINGGTKYSPGDQHTVELQGNFKGFMIVPVGSEAGTFNSVSNGKVLKCSSQGRAGGGFGDGIVHRNSSPKTSVSGMWTAPGGGGTVTMRVTVLLSYASYHQFTATFTEGGGGSSGGGSSGGGSSSGGSRLETPAPTPAPRGAIGSAQRRETKAPTPAPESPTPAPTPPPDYASSALELPESEEPGVVELDASADEGSEGGGGMGAVIGAVGGVIVLGCGIMFAKAGGGTPEAQNNANNGSPPRNEKRNSPKNLLTTREPQKPREAPRGDDDALFMKI